MRSIPALLADVANGIFATALIAILTNTEVMWWHFLIGIALAFLPDLDALPELAKRGKVAASDNHDRDHRDGIHYPVLFLVVGFLFILIEPFWGWLFLLATMLHFVNDFYGTGWGIQWFWPLSRKRFKLLGRRVNRLRSTLEKGGDWELLPLEEKKLRVIVFWDASELPKYITKWGQEEWIDLYYYKLNWISATEYFLFGLALFILCFSLIY